MKKNKILIILSIIEIISLIVFVLTFSFALSKTVEIAVSGWLNSWGGSNDVNLSSGEKFIMLLNTITEYVFLITFIIRFICTFKKNKIVLLIDLLIGIIAFVLLYSNQTILSVLGIILFVVTLVLYIYSHIIKNNDNYKKRKKSKKINQ